MFVKLRLLVFALLSSYCLLLVVSCNKEDTLVTYDCTGVAPTYTNDIKSIIDASCAKSGCHNATTRAHGLDYSTYAKLKAGTESDNFMGSIQHLSGYDAMPEDGDKLSDSKIKLISCWIANGTIE